MRQPNEMRVLDDSYRMGVQKLYRFANGRGASVVRHNFSYGGSEGLWELAVTRPSMERADGFEIDYSTPITSDVLGWLSDEEADRVLSQIEALPPLNVEIESAP